MTGIRGWTAAAACLAALVFAGCAAIAPKADANAKTVSVNGTEALYVAPPIMADTVDTLLARIGWGEGRMSQELRKELIYQFNRRGVATVEDSAAAKASLAIVLSEYVQGGGTASHYAVDALLKTGNGERRIALRKVPKGAAAPEREDPTLDNIRLIASSMVEESRKDPDAKKANPKKTPDYNPGLMMIF
jgi:hypothetical protein